MKTVPYGRQDINQDDIDSVVRVLKSDFLTQGPLVEEFESAVAKYTGAKYAVAVSSATAALHIGAQALGVGPGTSLVTSPNTFVATSNAAFYCGGKPEFVDIDLVTHNMDIERLKTYLKTKKPKVIAPVHFSGLSCSMKEVSDLAKAHGAFVMEDASHAIGAEYNGRKVGACEFSDLCVFSFHPVKIITSGEGGLVTTNNSALYESLKRLRSHGITRDRKIMTKDDGPWYYEQQDLGYNYRLTDIQAALGLNQLKRLDEFVQKRNDLADRYHKLLEGLPLQFQKVNQRSSYHLFVVRLELGKIKKTHRQVFEELQKKGIGVNLHYIPVYRQPYYKKLNVNPKDFPQMEAYYNTAITIPLYAGMTHQDQDRVVSALKEVLS